MSRFRREWQQAHPDEVYSMSSHCPLCNLGVQVKGGTIEDLSVAYKQHVQSHPEWAAYQATLPTIEELRAKRPLARGAKQSGPYMGEPEDDS